MISPGTRKLTLLKRRLVNILFSLIHVLDEIMCTDKDEILERQPRVLACKIFVHDLVIIVVRGYFSVGVYKYARPGSLSEWIVVFNLTRGASYDIQSVIETIDPATHQAPIFLSMQETSDYVASVRSQTGVNKKLAADVL